MTWFKRALWAFLIFFGLYLFGNFRINDVNVRDALRKAVPPESLAHTGGKFSTIARTVYQSVIDAFKEDQPKSSSDEKSLDSETHSQDEERSDDTKPSEHLSDADEKKMIKLLKGYIDEATQKADTVMPPSGN